MRPDKIKSDTITPQEKEFIDAENRSKYIDWLRFIIKDKHESLLDYQGKVKQCNILNREIKYYQDELDILLGFKTKKSEFDNMPIGLKNLYNELFKKQAFLITCKRDPDLGARVQSEINVIQKAIDKFESEMSGNKDDRMAYKEESSVPF